MTGGQMATRHGSAVGQQSGAARHPQRAQFCRPRRSRSSNARSAERQPAAAQQYAISPSMRVDFTRTPGRIALRDGVVRGPVLGGTIDGVIDYARDDVHLRGTLIPLYGANNLLGQLPVVGPVPRRRKGRAWSASPMKSSASPAIRCSTSIRSRRWRRDCCAKCSNSRQQPGHAPTDDRRRSDERRRHRARQSVTDRSSSHRLEQNVTLAAERKLDRRRRP